jgi:hypothetical protein
VIQRFDYDYWTTAFFQSTANLLQEIQSMTDARCFLLHRGRNRFDTLMIPIGLQEIPQRGERSHDDVICHGKRFQIFQIPGGEGGNVLADCTKTEFGRLHIAISLRQRGRIQ